MKNQYVFSMFLCLCVSTACSNQPPSSTPIPGNSSTESFSDSGSSSASTAPIASALCEEQEVMCLQGDMGDTGPQGLQGETGLQGEPGSQGLRGETGPRGTSGPQGPVGMTGLTGPAGATGQRGLQGQQGPQGPAGSTGTTGVQGDPGQDGQDGMDGAFDPGLLYVNSANELAASALAMVTSVTAECDAGDMMMTGNCITNTTGAQIRSMGMALPGGQPEGWSCTWNHPQNVGFLGAASVRCLDVP